MKILIADACADKAYIADHPGHAKSISGLFNRNGTGVLGATARIVALDAVRAHWIGGEGDRGAPQ